MNKKRLGSLLVVPLIAIAAISAPLSGCKNQTAQPGGAYAPTNSAGQVIYDDTNLALADASYKLAYTSIQTVFAFERDNRTAIYKLTPSVKEALDKVRPTVVDIDLRWATARRAYRLNPTPEGLSTINSILSEIARIVPAVQAQNVPLVNALTKPKH